MVLSSLSQPLPYTSSPVLLALQDLYLFLRITVVWPLTSGIPSVVLPFYPWLSGPLDELYPRYQNIKAVLLHLFLIVVQTLFLLILIPSLFIGLPIPLLSWTPTSIILIVGFVVGNDYFCILLNGTKRRFNSITRPYWEPHDDEKWVFINGVAAGDTWMQSNLDRLALTFRRPIHGIHNKTRGIIFDVIETIIQRTFGYATADIREAYADVIKFVEDEHEDVARYKKIVLILHSQGAVEGGLVLDWLFATVGREMLAKMEIYTFGSAANHFNNPDKEGSKRVIRHIEHYANLGDYVALFGILHFRPLPKRGRAYEGEEAKMKIENRYVGRLFARTGSGHQMNGNYLDSYFTMSMNGDKELLEVLSENAYMSSALDEELLEKYDIAGKVSDRDIWDCFNKGKGQNNSCIPSSRKVKDVSRLWSYRNGMSPAD